MVGGCSKGREVERERSISIRVGGFMLNSCSSADAAMSGEAVGTSSDVFHHNCNTCCQRVERTGGLGLGEGRGRGGGGEGGGRLVGGGGLGDGSGLGERRPPKSEGRLPCSSSGSCSRPKYQARELYTSSRRPCSTSVCPLPMLCCSAGTRSAPSSSASRSELIWVVAARASPAQMRPAAPPTSAAAIEVPLTSWYWGAAGGRGGWSGERVGVPRCRRRFARQELKLGEPILRECQLRKERAEPHPSCSKPRLQGARSAVQAGWFTLVAAACRHTNSRPTCAWCLTFARRNLGWSAHLDRQHLAARGRQPHIGGAIVGPNVRATSVHGGLV